MKVWIHAKGIMKHKEGRLPYAKFDSGVAPFPGNGPGNETTDRVVTAI